ncbi:hypothetical protein [Sphingomonas albertensis]|uniref:hypothetical protein n=1 Tax=Sphingomonas albertensis TaxID=2762591 RepID=UPI0037D9E459
MMFDIINSIARALLTVLIVYKLIRFHDMMIAPERMGLGLMASGSMMTVPIIWEGTRSPFDGWAVSVMTIGAVVFLAGRTWRDRKHQRANDRQVAYWEAHKAGKRGI